MKRRRAAVLCASLMAASLVTGGCGNGASGTDGTQEVETTQTAETAQTDNGSADGTISLTVWGAEEDAELLKQITDSFAKEYASQATFDITIAAESESNCKDALLGDVINAPDVFTFADDQLRALVASGVLEPIENSDEVASASVDGAADAASVNDQMYAYPLTADNGYFLYYNKEYFSDTDVQTLDQMLSVAAANGKKVTMDWSSGWYLYSFFGNTGMELGLNDDGISNYCNWNSQDGSIKGVDVAQSMLSIAANPGFLNTDDQGMMEGIQNGSIIAGISGVWSANGIEQAWGDNYAAIKLPTYTCAGQQVQMASFKGYKLVGANAYSKNAAWASKLAEWISNEQNQTLRFEQRQQGPANKKAAESGEIADSPAIQAVLAQSEFASLQRIGGNYWDPVQTFAAQMAAGNPTGQDLQDLLDTMVKGVTASNAQ